VYVPAAAFFALLLSLCAQFERKNSAMMTSLNPIGIDAH
jgi:hypothetical protein